MDPQLSIDSLLTAARLLEKNGQFLGLNPLTLSFPSLVFPAPLPQPTTTVDQPVVLPSPTPLKMRQERKCSASTSAMPYSTPTRKPSTKHSRAAHNELEKTRRANLRQCLEKLQQLVPPVSDSSRNTTLALLTRARDHIKYLDVAVSEAQQEADQKKQENEALRAELERLQEEKRRRTEARAVSCESSRVSPIFLEYSPSNKPSPRPIYIDPVAEGLLPALPATFNRPSIYPFFDLNPQPASQRPFLPIHLSLSV